MANFASYKPAVGATWYNEYYGYVTAVEGYATQIDNANALHSQSNLASTLGWIETHYTNADSGLQSQITTNLNTLNSYKTQIDNANAGYLQANLLNTFGQFSTTTVMQQYVQSAIQGGPNIPAIGPALSVVTINGAGDAFTGLTYVQIYGNLITNSVADGVARINPSNNKFTGQTILDLQRELSFTRYILCDCFLS